MNCKTAQQQMPLAVGDDLPLASRVEFDQHVCECDQCRSAWERHQQSYLALQQSRLEEELLNNRRSVWPQVRSRMEQLQRRPRRRESNNGVATLFLVAACVLATVSLLEDYTMELNQDAVPRRLMYSDVVFANYPVFTEEPWISPPLTEPIPSSGVNPFEADRDESSDLTNPAH